MRPSTSRRRPLLGFTLTELVVTLVVLGLLASVAAISYDGIIEDSRYATLEREAAEFDRHYRGKLAWGLNQPGFDPQTAAPTIAGEIIDDAVLGATIITYVTGGFVQFESSGASVCLTLTANHGISGTISRGACGGALSLSYASTAFTSNGSPQTLNASPSGGNGSYSYSISGSLPAGVSFNTTTGAFSTAGLNGRSAGTTLDASWDDGFSSNAVSTPGANGALAAVLVAPDDKVYVAGSALTTMDGVARVGIARLNSDGSLDTGFDASVSGGSINTMAVDSSGKLVIGGGFTSVNGTARLRIARLNSDGTLDTAFGTTTNGPAAAVQSLAIDSGGKIVIGGSFTTVGGTARLRVARLNSDGTLDTAFGTTTNGPAGTVNDLAIDSGGKIVIGGDFTTVGGTARLRIARLNSDGTLDTAFGTTTNGLNGTVFDLVVLSDNRVVISGNFTTVGGTARLRIARLGTTGALDTTFGTTTNGASTTVSDLALQSDGKVLLSMSNSGTVGGGGSGRYTARVGTNGAVDNTFNSVGTANGPVRAIALQSNGRLVIVGDFEAVDTATDVAGRPNRYMSRLMTDGSGDPTFGSAYAGPNAVVEAVALQSDGKVVIGGNFTAVSGTARNGIARYNSDGTVDPTFNPNIMGTVYTIHVLPSGKILVGGEFYGIGGGPTQSGIVRLNADGTWDTSFGWSDGETYVYGVVYDMAVVSDGDIYIAGMFTDVAGSGFMYMARLNSDGTLDVGFDTSSNTPNGFGAFTAEPLPDGDVMFGGFFTTTGTSRSNIARFNSDGTVDTSFGTPSSGPSDNAVMSIARQSDGKFVIGGYFTTVGGNASNAIARLNADGTFDPTFTATANSNVDQIQILSDGKLLVGGGFSTLTNRLTSETTTRRGVALLNSDGTVNTTFGTATSGVSSGNAVKEFAFGSDGSLLVVGLFTTAAGSPSVNVARYATGPAPGFPVNVTVTVTSHWSSFSLPVTLTAS